MWIELTTMRAPDYFGEAAMQGRTVRGAAAIADSTVEVLVLLKLDFDLKIDPETRDMLNVLVAQYPKDEAFVRCLAWRAGQGVVDMLVRGACSALLEWTVAGLFWSSPACACAAVCRIA